MKFFVAIIVMASILANAAAPASASKPHKHKKSGRAHTYTANKPSKADAFIPNGTIEYDLRKVPFGTSLWWQQSDRERETGY
jgi:hypothetical protein